MVLPKRLEFIEIPELPPCEPVPPALEGPDRSRGDRHRGDPLPLIGTAVFTRRDVLVVPDSRVPPDAFGLLAVFGKQHLKTAFAIVPRLLPGSLPEPVGNLGGVKTAAMLCIGAIAAFVQRGSIAFVVFHFQNVPLAA